MLILGVGIGVSFPGLITLTMAGATPEDAGLASGLVNTAAQMGGALGLAILATISATRSRDLIAAGHSTASALTSGYHLAFLVGAGLVVVALVISVGVLRAPEIQGARRATEAEAEAEAGGPAPAYSEAS
jgi:MFS family permease